MDFAQKLARVIEVSGLTQQQLASQLEVTFATVNSWINRRSTPRSNALARIDALFAEYVEGNSLDEDQLAELIKTAQLRRIDIGSIVANKRIIDNLALQLTYHTDAIEGSTMTIADTQAVIFDNVALATRTLVEQLEARNHHAALLWLLDQMSLADFSIDQELILSLHAKLMNGIQSDAGTFRRHAVRIVGTRVVVANPASIAKKIEQLCNATQDRGDASVDLLAYHHATFEKIHPFSDGNGRVGRLLLLALCLKAGRVPPIIYRERRTVYYKALETAQVANDERPLRQFLAESIVATSRDVFGQKQSGSTGRKHL